MSAPYCAVYDFELMPYALGDVLTWNVQTAIRCEQAGRDRVDVLICMDERHPANIYQRDLVSAENCGLFFNELYGAFGTHPKLGNIALFRRREELLAHLRAAARDDAANAEVLADYEKALSRRTDDDALIEYFTKYIHSHERINAFAKREGRIPLLHASLGTEPDVAGLLATRFAEKRVVAIHTRMRRLDVGYGGEHTYARDSDFLEWYEFLKDAAARHPAVQFVLLGRLQEKPLEVLKLPNVASLRLFGLGLGHELTLVLKSDLFIGTSSGFAAMANFSEAPYFVTRMTPASCKAYRIEQGAERLPFAAERQTLVYEPETRDMLMRLLERGLAAPPRRQARPGPGLDSAIDVKGWAWERSQWLYPDATTHRFFHEGAFADKETAFLLWPKLKDAEVADQQGRPEDAWAMLDRVATHFPQLIERFPEYLRLRKRLALRLGRAGIAVDCDLRLSALAAADSLVEKAARYARRLYPAGAWLKWAWSRKHRLPGKLLRLVRNRPA
jgi:hypothetical protein